MGRMRHSQCCHRPLQLMLPTILLFRLGESQTAMGSDVHLRHRIFVRIRHKDLPPTNGCSVVAAGGVRTYYLSKAESLIADKTWILFTVWIASIVECNVAVICACAPSLNFVFGKFFRDVSSAVTGSLGSSWNSNSKQTESSRAQRKPDRRETGRTSPDTCLMQQLSARRQRNVGEKGPGFSLNETPPVFDAAVSEPPTYARAPADPFGPAHRPRFNAPGATLAVPPSTIADNRSGA